MVVYERERGGKVDVVLESVRGRKAQAFVRCCRVLDVHQLELIKMTIMGFCSQITEPAFFSKYLDCQMVFSI